MAAARSKFLEENNYPQRYRDLINAKATSDDKYDGTQKKWLIKRRPERSTEAEKFFRILDQKRELTTRQTPSQKWREHVQVVPATDQQDSTFQVLPEQMPIDYFDPSFFNQLQPKIRNRIAIVKVSLLPDITQSFTSNDEEYMGDRAFTKKYGATVFARYHMVSDSDIEDVGGNDEWVTTEDEDDDMSLIVADDVTVIASSRSTISSHLAGSSGSSMSAE